MHAIPEEPVYEKMPAIGILHLVKEQMAEIAIDGIKAFKDIIQILRSSNDKPFIVEVNIGKIPSR